MIDIIISITEVVKEKNSSFVNSNNCNIKVSEKNNISYRHNVYIHKIVLDEISSINPNKYIIFDCETTGLDSYSGDRIIEFCFLKYKNGILIDKFTSLVNPNIRLPLKIIDITGINNEDLENQKPMEYFINDIIKFVNNQIVIGHNVTFDIEFLKTEINKCHFDTDDLCFKYIDTLEMVKKTIYDIENNKLETLKKYFNIKTKSHRAEADCETTFIVYNKCFEILYEKEIRNKKLKENYEIREKQCLEKMSKDEKDILEYFIKVGNEHSKEIKYTFKSDKSISFTLCGIEIGRIKYNGKKHYCRLYAGDSKKHIWENAEIFSKEDLLSYIDDLFIYIDKEYKRYFLEYGDKI